MQDELFIRRCFDLARLGEGTVSPNPLVGAVLVHEGQIIGESWHKQWGAAHAEVNCLHSVKPQYQHLIPKATLYCNLEPCNHFGKTPPCTVLIKASKIGRVVLSNTDPNPLVAGKGIESLKNEGIKVITGVLEQEGAWINRAFFTWIGKKRPHIVLKWAQSADGFTGRQDEKMAISGPQTQRLVHRWRAASDAILVGSKTALLDNPVLDARHYFGKNPLRILLDVRGKIPHSHHLFKGPADTWVFGSSSGLPSDDAFIKIIPSSGTVALPDILEVLKKENKAILLVEGGAQVQRQFLASGLWDEIRVIENPMRLGEGVLAPDVPPEAILMESIATGKDTIRIFAKPKPA